MADSPVNPYTTPREESLPNPVTEPPGPMRVLAQLACWTHGVAVSMSLLYFLTYAVGIMFPEPLNRPYVLVFAFLHPCSWIFFLCWTYFAARHARAMNPAVMTISPRKAAGIYFIPVGNLYIPYLAMHDITLAILARKERWQIKVWWALVLATYMIPLYAAVIEGFANVGNSYFTQIYLQSTPYLVIRAACAVLGIGLVVRITRGDRSQLSAAATRDAR